ncbi:MAG: hypothetical protein LAP85_10540 [Acidobacteriia bacterium]|nr:hypothetical protein [Terriglobia bacterium]
MGRYVDAANRVLVGTQRPDVIDGHEVAEILWETPKMVVFRDPEGRLWRRVHSWGMTWPVVVTEAKQ